MIPDHRMADLLVFKTKRRIDQVAQQAEPRYMNRQSDQLAAAFYEACRIGNLDAASQFMQALEAEVAQSSPPPEADKHEDGNDLAAVRARFAFEMARKERADGTGA